MVNSVIRKCTCKHPSQDEIHGKDMRVFNICERKEGSQKAKCTVCGNIITVTGE
jgi:hypothetical protein